jgi:phosphopantetheinyl transferase
MEQRKLRLGKTAKPGQQEVHVITIPPNIAMFYNNVYFSITHSGTTIILTSGNKINLDKPINIDIKIQDFKL